MQILRGYKHTPHSPAPTAQIIRSSKIEFQIFVWSTLEPRGWNQTQLHDNGIFPCQTYGLKSILKYLDCLN